MIYFGHSRAWHLFQMLFQKYFLLVCKQSEDNVRVTEMFIPLNRNICPLSIYLWGSWLDFFMVYGEWQACCRSHPSYPKVEDLKCIGWTLQENCPFFPLTLMGDIHSEVRLVAYNVDISVCTDQSSIKKNTGFFCYNKFDSSISYLSWQTKHLVKGKVKLEAKNTGGN